MMKFVGTIISEERASCFRSIKEASTCIMLDVMLCASCQQEMLLIIIIIIIIIKIKVLILGVFTRRRSVYKILEFLVEVDRSGSYEITLRAVACRSPMFIAIAFNLSIRTFS